MVASAVLFRFQVCDAVLCQNLSKFYYFVGKAVFVSIAKFSILINSFLFFAVVFFIPMPWQSDMTIGKFLAWKFAPYCQ